MIHRRVLTKRWPRRYPGRAPRGAGPSAPACPPACKAHRTDQDYYYTLPADRDIPTASPTPGGPGGDFAPGGRGHAFHSRTPPPMGRIPGSRALAAQCPRTLRTHGTRTRHGSRPGPPQCLGREQGHLAACLLLDTAPHRFLSYLLGAHSRIHYTAHASDLLFLKMIQLAQREHKDFVHLGLGVNDGIRRFKTKWGGTPSVPYEMAAWEEKSNARADMNEFMRALRSMPGESMSKQQFLASLPPQRRFAMLWEVEKDERRSWMGGTAHFFCYSFETSFRELFERVDTVLFEGPLDQASLDRVAKVGRSPAAGSPRLIEALTEEEIRRLEQVVCGPQGFWATAAGIQFHRRAGCASFSRRNPPLDGLFFALDQFSGTPWLASFRGS